MIFIAGLGAFVVLKQKGTSEQERKETTHDIPPLKGARFQVYRSLENISRGQPLVMMHRIPITLTSLDNDDEMERKRLFFFDSLKDDASWEDMSMVAPVFVPGTHHPHIVAHIMLTRKWCRPGKKHWVPNFRFFDLTEEGCQSLDEARVWWRSLTMRERLSMALRE